jgi:organic hydroperoxide reductase OsmC/OhrA
MLTFLWLASKAGVTVTRYRDAAVGVMKKNDRGVPWVSKVTLSPVIEYAATPSHEVIARLHHEAHEGCFIANSVKTEIVVASV